MIRHLRTLKGKAIRGEGTGYKKPSRNELLWLFLLEPKPEEVAKVVKDFGLERRPFDLFSREKHSVRYSMDPFQFVIVDYYVENDKVGASHLLFSIKDNVLILVASKSAKFYYELFDSISEGIEKNKIPTSNIGRILHAFLQEDIEGNYDVLEKTEEQIAAIEERAANFEGTKPADIKDIIKLKRKLFMMGRRFWASTKIIFLLKAGFTNVKIDPETSKLLIDVHDTFLHQIDIVTAQKEMLSDVMSIYSTNINNRLAQLSNDMGNVTKKVSSFALILLLPTLIASFYGMNFAHIPLASTPYGFYAVIAGTVATTLILWLLFKKVRWL